jgi:predicted nucleic acid-binding protein
MGKITKVDRALSRIAGKRTYLDANLLIYFFNDHPQYFEIAESIILAAERREFLAHTSKAVIAEVMVHPYRSGNPELIAKFRAFFDQSFITVVGNPDELFDVATMYAGTRSMKLIDALHYATALHFGCTAIVSNDKKFMKQRDHLEIINIDELVEP